VRLVHISDLHLGFRQFQRQTPAGINQREADVAAVFRTVIDRVIEIRPELVLLAGDIFHNVRPPNPAILHAFTQFGRLTQALPDALVVMIAGNHDTPRAAETGCILQLFAPLGIHVVDGEPRRLTFPERDLSILAVPDTERPKVLLDPDPRFAYNILLMHQLVEGVIPAIGADAERVAMAITTEEIGAARWSYVALGNYHVHKQVAPNAYYSGSIEYTSNIPWWELHEQRALKLQGKGFIEYDLSTARHQFHKIKPARAFVDLPIIPARGMAAADIDEAIRSNLHHLTGGIDNKVVRQVVENVPRHIAREIDHKTLREYKRRALHFHLDTRRPDIILRQHVGQGAPGKRPSLVDTVRERLWSRPLPSDIDREQLVELGLTYLQEAEARESATAVNASGGQEDEE
jgi:exonuclease SbcD